MRFHWRILQEGQLSLRPRGAGVLSCEHRATSVLVWPENEPPARGNTVVADPCFTPRGFEDAQRVLAGLGLTFHDVGQFFVTHLHGDHMYHVPEPDGPWMIYPLRLDAMPAGMALVPCPGHEEDLDALAFFSAEDGEVWIVGDAILDEEWLRAWRYYWPNGYDYGEIEQTWRTVAAVLSRADLVIPGHGAPIRVTASLVKYLANTFPGAERAAECPVVPHMLAERLDPLLRQSQVSNTEH